MKRPDTASKRDAAEEYLVRLKKQQAVRAWRGKLAWSDDLNAMRLDNCNTRLECGDSKCG